MKKNTILLFLLLLTSFSAFAQKYRTNIGARLGRNDFGVSLQQKILEEVTLEGIAGVGSREADFTLLVEKHYPLIGKGFNYYIGAGAHVGTVKEYGGFYGADVILGTELKLPIFPLVISLDIKPAIHASHSDWFAFDGGFTLRYILVKEKVEKKRFGIFGGGNRNDDNDRNRRNKKNKKEAPKRRLFEF
ncbi:hypothetical protein [Adhaeribacter rhizoryzae]|uniref:Uncharacterized protein n=1 Tax=Adhaeribacter rhizoryzae TaxID=2607907 RepID=A0A5M6DMK7_9BACT|nr:hypothetical protein [Adhaeribacter rhizoryzae]KAA5548623.1 hypothetical protein F0145_03655 [Adhaeribacter rhizoryzae]